MNAFVGDKQASVYVQQEMLWDWAVDIDRISRLARDAFLTETPDPWAKIEAECVLQLIDAELIALNERPRRDHRVEASIRHLKALRTQTVLAIRTLQGVERYSPSETAAIMADHAPGAGQARRRVNKPPEGALAAA